MFTDTIAALMRRELATLRREVMAYPDEASVWVTTPGVANSGGVLVRHLCGNLQHYIGHRLGGSGYRREREAEFRGAPVPRAALLAEIDATERAVTDALARLEPSRLVSDFPEVIAGHRYEMMDLLTHIAVHLGFHLGQLDYHRRLLSGSAASAEPVGLTEIASARPA